MLRQCSYELASSGRDLYRALDLAERATRVQRNADTLDTLGVGDTDVVLDIGGRDGAAGLEIAVG